jgi:hypothetical protein
LGITVELEINMKKQILIASIAPTFWVCSAIWMVGTPPAHHEPGEMLTGGIVIAAAIMVIPCAVIGYLCGKDSKSE